MLIGGWEFKIKNRQTEIAILQAINSVLTLEVPLGRGNDKMQMVFHAAEALVRASSTIPAAGAV